VVDLSGDSEAEEPTATHVAVVIGAEAGQQEAPNHGQQHTPTLGSLSNDELVFELGKRLAIPYPDGASSSKKPRGG